MLITVEGCWGMLRALFERKKTWASQVLLTSNPSNKFDLFLIQFYGESDWRSLSCLLGGKTKRFVKPTAKGVGACFGVKHLRSLPQDLWMGWATPFWAWNDDLAAHIGTNLCSWAKWWWKSCTFDVQIHSHSDPYHHSHEVEPATCWGHLPVSKKVDTFLHSPLDLKVSWIWRFPEMGLSPVIIHF